ncbi:metal-dependent phosphohydrolase, partial [Streptomyces sp. 2RAF24]
MTGVMGVKGIPRTARVYIGCALLAATAAVLPALRPGAPTPWHAVLLLAALYAVCELPARCTLAARALGQAPGGAAPLTAGSFFPVLIAAALLLPPAAAALTALPGAVLG